MRPEASDRRPDQASSAVLAQTAIAAVDAWFAHERARLRTQAETLEVETMARLRARRNEEGAGRTARLAMRVREPRRPGGSFTIEWFRVRGRGRTDYIPRGAGDSYLRSAFASALPWERQIALAAEQTLGAIRRRLRLMKDAELRLGSIADLSARCALLDDDAGA